MREEIIKVVLTSPVKEPIVEKIKAVSSRIQVDQVSPWIVAEVKYPAHRAGHFKKLEKGDCIPFTPTPHSSPSTGRGILRENFIKI